MFKVKGDDNPADLLTKYSVVEKRKKCLSFTNAEFRAGRASTAPERKAHERIIGEDMDWQTVDDQRAILCRMRITMS